MIFLFVAVFPAVVNAERVFSDTVLKAWGYQTTRIGKTHDIRSVKNYGDSKVAFYARFHLRVATFKDEAEAIAEMNRIESKRKSTVLGRDKNYQRILRKERVLYFITATSNRTRLAYQPALMKLIKRHLDKQKK